MASLARLEWRLATGAATGAAADKVDDFEAVAVFQRGLGPAVAGDDVAVEFNRDAVGLHAERFDQRSEREVVRADGIGKGTLVSVNVQSHSLYSLFDEPSHRE
ncbi:MAG: hypothetical protein JWQ87_362 [Candidatus Sulfotelmatobacter sp.]|nr:hypothetical protein [Candidatus Sulfotelmatobacter sp.]